MLGEIADVADGVASKDDNWIEDYRNGVIDMFENGLLDDFRRSKTDK